MELEKNKIAFIAVLFVLVYFTWGIMSAEELPGIERDGDAFSISKLKIIEGEEPKPELSDPFGLGVSVMAAKHSQRKGKKKGKGKKPIDYIPPIEIKAILGDALKRIVFIENEAFKVGDVIKESKIVHIETQKVVFEYDGRRFEKTLEVPKL